MSDSLIAHISAHGYHLTNTAKSAKLEALLHQANTLPDILRDDALLRLLTHAQFRKETPYTWREMLQIARPTQPDDFQTRLVALLDARLIRRGYYLRCDTCTLQDWYTLAHLSDDTVCNGCRQPLRIALDADFACRANPLFADALRNGGLTVWLTAAYVQSQHPGTAMTRLLCTEIRGQGVDTDLDVMLFNPVSKNLMLVECKDRLPADTSPMLKKQLETLAQLARTLKASAYLATLDTPATAPPTLPPGVHFISREMLLLS